jgi:2-iminobutanoate/2-iminopropanoate deaminase
MKERATTRIPFVNDEGQYLYSEIAVAHGIAATTIVANREDGSIETGDIEAQTRLAFDNLKATLARVNADLGDVLQLTIYLTNIEDRHGFNEVYQEYFSHPYPIRAAIGVSELAVEGMKVELTVLAAVG